MLRMIRGDRRTVGRYASLGRASRLLILRILLAAFAAAVLFGATGCVRVKATITVSPDDRVSGRIMVVTKARDDDDAGPQLQSVLPFDRKVAISTYRHDGFVGSQASFSDLTFAELPQLAAMSHDAGGVNLSLRRSGGTVILEGRADLSSLTDPETDIGLTVAFPGNVISTDGERVGSDAVQWRLSPGAVNTMNAQARYGDPSVRSFVSGAVTLGLAALLVTAAVAAMAWHGRDRTPRIRPVYEQASQGADGDQ